MNVTNETGGDWESGEWSGGDASARSGASPLTNGSSPQAIPAAPVPAAPISAAPVPAPVEQPETVEPPKWFRRSKLGVSEAERRQYQRDAVLCTEDVQRAICRGIELGMSERQAFLRAGLSPKTAERWQKWIRGACNGPMAQLRVKLQVAKTELEYKALSSITKAFDDDWRSAAWVLERRFPEKYGRLAVKHEHSGGVGVEHSGNVGVKLDFTRPPDPEKIQAAILSIGDRLRGRGASLPPLSAMPGAMGSIVPTVPMVPPLQVFPSGDEPGDETGDTVAVAGTVGANGSHSTNGTNGTTKNGKAAAPQKITKAQYIAFVNGHKKNGHSTNGNGTNGTTNGTNGHPGGHDG